MSDSKQKKQSDRLGKALSNKNCVSCHNLRVHPKIKFENKTLVKCKKNGWNILEKSEGINRKEKEYIRLSYILSTMEKFVQISYKCDSYETCV